ncbi:MAG: AAA family ATPase [Bacteroidia bacterium]|nr:AAA family ATPase [Bacteroidia bacterium]
MSLLKAQDLKKQGRIINISGSLGFVELNAEKRFAFDIEKGTDLRIGDIVDFEVIEVAVSISGEAYYKASNLSLVIRTENTQTPPHVRLSQIAKRFNISISLLVLILERYNIKVEANPNAKISNEQLALVLNNLTGLEELDHSITFRREFQKKYKKGSEIDVRVSKVVPPSQIFTLFADGFLGRLSLIDLSWSVPQAEELFKKITEGSWLKCIITDIDFENKQVKLSIKHGEKKGSDSILWNRIDRGDVFTSSFIEELPNSYILLTEKGFYCILSKEHKLENLTEPAKVKIIDKIDSLDLFRVIPASVEVKEDLPQPVIQTNDFGLIDIELRNFEAFKKSILGNHASDQDIEAIRNYFAGNENLFSKEIEAPFTWHISFESNSSVYETTFKQNAIAYFLEGQDHSSENETRLLEKLSTAGYWTRVNPKFRKGDIIEFSLFNEDVNFFGEVEISKDQKSVKCLIKNFSFGQSFSGASKAKKQNSRIGAYFLRSPLIISSPNTNLTSDESNKKVIDFILEKSRAFEILTKLKQEAGEILREEGRTLGLIDKFLEYQESLLDRNKTIPVYVEKFERTNALNGTVAITIDQSVGNSLEIEDDSMVNIKVPVGSDSQYELEWFSDATISFENNKCKLVFYRDVSLNSLRSGFYVEIKVSKAQLQIQRSIIQDFLQKKIKIDHIESLLVQPEKIKPPILSTKKLFNPDLINTEIEQRDNNQIKAVRKAIGNGNIFLIQGPPGTGKTTVIAEIINQLASDGKRILVTGQNHVAVDNVLSKISKDSTLNLLRVGKEDKIDKSLSIYHIDNLVNEYQETFNEFLQNQLTLLKYYLRSVKDGKTREKILPEYNDTVNNYIAKYGNLKEILKQRHFLLLDGISDLSVLEMQDTIKAYEKWLGSINNEIDTLIQPLIYGSVDVVFATCIGIKTDPVFRDAGLRFDTVIIDEAGKANIAETLVAIELGKEVILVGDQMQLPPYMDSSLIDPNDPKSFPRSEFGYGYLQEEIIRALKTSFFEFLIKRIEQDRFPKENLEMLNYQHRMHPNIGKFVSESFYGGKVLMGAKTHQNKLDYPSPFNKEVVFFDTSNTPSPYEIVEGTSAKNNTEAEAIVDIILPLLFENHLPTSEIAIIAPYKSQVANIKYHINNSEKCQHKNIDVSTLDSFQGKEYDVILFSFTRSSDHEASIRNGKKPVKVGFLDDAKRLNVAFSRAKKKLILIGNAKTLTDKRSHFDLLFNYTELFSKLVRLSKEELIGNFVNIADYRDFKSPFEKLTEKYKSGDKVLAKYKSCGTKGGATFGHFFKVEGYDCLLPIAFIEENNQKKFSDLSVDTTMELFIKYINSDNKRVTLQILAPEKRSNGFIRKNTWKSNIANIKVGQKLPGKIVKKVNFGYFVKLECGIEGLLHTTKVNKKKKLTEGQQILVKIIRIDNDKQQITFSYT